MMNVGSLPLYLDEELATYDVLELVDLLLRDEDRVPRNVIHECARRGSSMAVMLIAVLQDDEYWSDELSRSRWWLKLHAIMILGLIPSEEAGLALVEAMRRISDEGEFNLEEWCAGHWSALFRNKPQEVCSAIEVMSVSEGIDPSMRQEMLDTLIGAASYQGPEVLDARLAFVAQVAANEEEEWDMRCLAGTLLLQFPRVEHRPLLNALAAKQRGIDAIFSKQSVNDAYAAMADYPALARFSDPWQLLYAPEAIEERQQRWAKEDAVTLLGDKSNLPYPVFSDPILPIVRDTPKIGRNEPCPCGSGKKYKKCCLNSSAE